MNITLPHKLARSRNGAGAGAAIATEAGTPGGVTGTPRETFHFVMIKPSHYDDDGYPIQWLRSAIPSNTLACLFALADDARRRRVLGPAVDLKLHTYDETNRRVRPARIMRMIRAGRTRRLVSS